MCKQALAHQLKLVITQQKANLIKTYDHRLHHIPLSKEVEDRDHFSARPRFPSTVLAGH